MIDNRTKYTKYRTQTKESRPHLRHKLKITNMGVGWESLTIIMRRILELSL